MKMSVFLLLAFMDFLILFPIESMGAQTALKKSLSQVPITYPGDTDKTITRRAQWIEGAKKEGMMVWWGILSPELKNQVIAEFNKIYPFIKVDHWRGNSAEISAKLEAEFIGGRVSADITMGASDENYPRWRKSGVMEKLAEIIPEIEKMDKRMYSSHGDWVRVSHVLTMPAYNTKLVPAADAPKTWEDLVQARWKGRQIGVQAQMAPWVILALGEGGWGIENTRNYLAKLREQQPVHTPSYSAGLSLLTAGEYKMMPDNLLFLVLNAQSKSAPVEWVKANPIAVYGPVLSLTAKAPHPNAGRLFVEWLSSHQGSQTYGSISGQGVAFPGWGTRQSKLVDGMNLVVQTEEVIMKSIELGLESKFSEILGIKPEEK